MGQSNSKLSEDGTKIFTPVVNIDQSLSTKFEELTESDIVRRLREDSELENALSAKLLESKAKVEKQLEDAFEKVPDINKKLKSLAKDTSSTQLYEDLANLRKELESQRKSTQLSEEAGKAKEELVTCLQKNTEKPLNCRKEYAEFLKLVADI